MSVVIARCDGWCEGANTVTHIGAKGYIYCKPCALVRRESGYERTRAMRPWELKLIALGLPLPSYALSRKPIESEPTK